MISIGHKTGARVMKRRRRAVCNAMFKSSDWFDEETEAELVFGRKNRYRDRYWNPIRCPGCFKFSKVVGREHFGISIDNGNTSWARAYPETYDPDWEFLVYCGRCQWEAYEAYKPDSRFSHELDTEVQLIRTVAEVPA